METMGKIIRLLRVKNNMSQQQLSQQLNVTRQAISNWENNKTEPDIAMIRKMAEIFHTDIQTIVEGTSQNKKEVQSLILFLLCIISFLVHFVMSLTGQIKVMGVIISPGIGLMMGFIIYFIFASSLKNNDFSIIAGYDKNKKYNMNVFRKIMNQIRDIYLLLTFITNILYTLIYTIDKTKQMPVNLIFLGIYAINLVSVVVIVNLKYKKDLYQN